MKLINIFNHNDKCENPFQNVDKSGLSKVLHIFHQCALTGDDGLSLLVAYTTDLSFRKEKGKIHAGNRCTFYRNPERVSQL